MISEFCILLYSHSDYSDLWDLTFGQIYKHVDLNTVPIVFCVNRLDAYKIDDRIKIHYYDDKHQYTDRVLSIVENLNYDHILFIHEDWVLIDNFIHNYVLNLIKCMKDNNILHVRSYKNFGNSNMKSDVYINDICNIPKDAASFVSLQPGIWEKNTLKDLFMIKSNKPNILEQLSNPILRHKYNHSFFYESNSIIAEESKMFPHIHTITYGRWAMCNDKRNILDSLMLKYKIDKKKRGYFNRLTKEDYYP